MMDNWLVISIIANVGLFFFAWSSKWYAKRCSHQVDIAEKHAASMVRKIYRLQKQVQEKEEELLHLAEINRELVTKMKE